jgi:hypothetical protein
MAFLDPILIFPGQTVNILMQGPIEKLLSIKKYTRYAISKFVLVQNGGAHSDIRFRHFQVNFTQAQFAQKLYIIF